MRVGFPSRQAVTAISTDALDRSAGHVTGASSPALRAEGEVAVRDPSEGFSLGNRPLQTHPPGMSHDRVGAIAFERTQNSLVLLRPIISQVRSD